MIRRRRALRNRPVRFVEGPDAVRQRAYATAVAGIGWIVTAGVAEIVGSAQPAAADTRPSAERDASRTDETRTLRVGGVSPVAG